MNKLDITKIKSVFETVKYNYKIILKRLLFSIPAGIAITVVTVLLCFAEREDGTHLTFIQLIIIDLIFYIIYLIPLTVIFRIIQTLLRKENFLDFLIRPSNFSKIEKYGAYTDEGFPTDDIQTINENNPIYLDKLQDRIPEQDVLKKIENDFDNMDGHEFENYCADVLRKNKFINVEVTQGSGDHGIDILAEKDGITYAIQCKRYSSNIGNAAVQQAHTGKSLYHKDIAVVLTNQYFTTQAKEEANALGVKLWDRDKLQEMINNIN